MDGCHFLPTTDLQNRQDVYFLRENYTEHFNYVDFFFCSFVLFIWFLPLSRLPGLFFFFFFLFARRGRFPLRLYWSPPNATPQTPQTGAIKHWSLEKQHTQTHTHAQHLCYCTSWALSLLHIWTINHLRNDTVCQTKSYLHLRFCLQYFSIVSVVKHF